MDVTPLNATMGYTEARKDVVDEEFTKPKLVGWDGIRSEAALDGMNASRRSKNRLAIEDEPKKAAAPRERWSAAALSGPLGAENP